MGQTQAASTITLNDIQYSAQGGHSRVTLIFDGEIRYSPSLAGGVVRLGLSRTSVAVPMKARRQLPRTGLVSAISVTPVSNDSVVVAIMLQPATTYRCVLQASGNTLHVDVLPADGRTVGREMLSSAGRLASAVQPVVSKPKAAPQKSPVRESREGSVQTQPRNTSETESARVPTSSMVDIPAIAREQLSTEAPQRGLRITDSRAESSRVSPAMAVGLASLIAALISGAGAALLLGSRRKPSKATVPPAPVRPVPTSPAGDLAPRAKMDRDPIADAPEDNDESEFIHDTSLQLARSFRRGSEEITLARRLHERTTPQLTGARMDETLVRATTPNQRLHFARKLGVGRGEMDLAMKLKAIRPVEKREGIES